MTLIYIFTPIDMAILIWKILDRPIKTNNVIPIFERDLEKGGSCWH